MEQQHFTGPIRQSEAVVIKYFTDFGSDCRFVVVVCDSIDLG